MKQILRQKIPHWLIYLLTLTIVLVAALIVYRYFFTPHVYLLNDNELEQSDEGVKYVVAFPRAVVEENLKLVIDPSAEYTLTSIDNQTVSIDLIGPFHPDYEYEISVMQSDHLLKQWKFKTLPAQSDPIAFRDVEIAQDKDYPLRNVVPYIGESFDVDYYDPLTLQVLIKIEDSELAKQLFQDWLKEQGLSVGSHEIRYKSIFP